MLILGCKCLNVLIHIEKTLHEVDGGLTGVQLTLDGINVQQHFLVHEVKQGDWTVVKCKVCNICTYRKFNQEMQVYHGLENYTHTVIQVQNLPDFSAAFNLILPEKVHGEQEEFSASWDLKSLDLEVSKLKKDMKVVYQEKLANFIRTEKQTLDSNFEMVEDAEQKIRGLVNHYHQNNKCDLPSSATNSGSIPSAITSAEKTRKSSYSERKVTFSTSEDLERTDKARYGQEEVVEHSRDRQPVVARSQQEEPDYSPKSPVSQEEYFQFDLADDDLFMTPAEQDILGSRQEESESEDDLVDEDSSSSGCEADMALEGKSVPINLPMNYSRESGHSRRLSSSKGDDIAHSMKTMMEAFHGGPENDVPRPRVISKSYNPSRMNRS